MSSLGSLTVQIGANLARFEAAMGRMQYLTNQSVRAVSRDISGMKASFDAIPGAIGKIATSAAALTGIAYVFKKAISATDEFRVSIIGIAAGLTNIAKPGQGSFEDIFKRNISFAKEMYKELERVAAKTPAEPMEMQTAYNQLVQQGYALRLDEADALGVLVTRIKLATQGQDANRQINQEIRSLYQGQAVEGAMLAKELETRLGPAWKDILGKQKESGNWLNFLAGLWPGIVAAGAEFEKTLTAQGTTLQGHLKYLGREGLGGAYDDIVGYVRDINDYLTKHEDLIAGDIRKGWWNVKGAVEAVADLIKGGATSLVSFGANLDKIANNPALMAIIGAAGGAMVGRKFGFTGAVIGGAAGAGAGLLQYDKSQMKKFLPGGPHGEAAETFYGPIPSSGPPPAVQPPTGGGKGGGSAGAIKDSTRELENYWKVMDSIYKSAEDNIKQIDIFLENMERGQSDSLELQKGLYDQLAKFSPVLGDHVGFKQKALDLEIQIGQAVFDKKLAELENLHIVEKAQADELRGLQALTNQAKRYNLAMEDSRGVAGWAHGRKKEMGQRDTIKDSMIGAEKWISQSVSRGIMGALKGEKVDFAMIGWDIADAFVSKTINSIISGAFDILANVFLSGSNSLLTASDSLSGSLMDGASGLSGVSEQFDGMFSDAIGGLGGILMSIVEGVGGFLGIFHQGGIVTAHQGLKLGHNEVLMKALNDEWILNPRATSQLSKYGPDTFNMLNSGKLPIVPVQGEGGGSSAPTVVNAPISVTINPHQEMKQGDYDRHVGMILKSLNRKLGNHGVKLTPGRN